jgi:uncharacterized membrane protein/thiol-disulfide isomerase/thioredoxin
MVEWKSHIVNIITKTRSHNPRGQGEKMVKRLVRIIIYPLMVGLIFIPFSLVSANNPVVRAVLFFSPTCSHCHKVMTEDLPPLQAQYQDQLKILEIDVTQEAGQTLYQKAIEQFNISPDKLGVPTLIMGGEILVGSLEIPARLPQLIEAGLRTGGIDWPAIDGLQNHVQAQFPTTQESPSAQGSVLNGMLAAFLRDPLANSISVVTLLIMLVSALLVGNRFLNAEDYAQSRWPTWIIPVLSVLGIGVAIYLTFIETTHQQAICGPIGNCNTVQQSPYAHLFGFLPVGLLGVIGYAAILLAWLAQKLSSQQIHHFAVVGIWVMSWFGVLFSIYLTFLEAFVIGSTCVWCISSALLMTLLLWASTGPALQVLSITESEHNI